jgi:hypothetical protein
LSKPRIEGTEITDEDKNGFMLCIHQLDRRKGIDLILHTPGGSIAATESLVDYLRRMFGKDIRAIIPQIAMSAGTMIACSCKEIIMGRHSNLGPIDPQFGAIPAYGVIQEIKKAAKEIKADPSMALIWQPILGKLPISFVQQCEWAIERSLAFLQDSLELNMFSELPYDEKKTKIAHIVSKLTDLSENKGHNKHFHIDECLEMKLTVSALEKDPKLQDLVLTIHHCYMHSLSNTPVVKITENQLGKAIIKSQQPMVMPQGVTPASIGFDGSS